MKPIIEVENISKQYRLGLVGTGTLVHDVNRWWQTSILKKEDPYLKIGEVNDRTIKGSSDYVWALKDINFKVQPGEVLGIIGKNGAGKSTLLKLLSRVTAPTTGRITAHGRIASLLEVGTGFHPELTGRENIFLNGAILGMTRAEVKSKFDEIVDFAGCERYIDTPVKRYSSGMYVRLAFAVAAHLEPEILVVDEVLAVGDAEFQTKAIGKMQEVSQGDGRTVLFVSHNMASVQNLCSNVLILENGTKAFEGETEIGIQRYLQKSFNKSTISLIERKDRKGNGLLRFKEVVIKNNGNKIIDLQSGCKAEFCLKFNIVSPIENVIFRLIVIDKDDNIRFVCNNYHSSKPIKYIESSGEVSLIIDNFPLPSGEYSFHLQALSNKIVMDEIEFVDRFLVESGDFYKTGKIPNIKSGVYVKHDWKYNQIHRF